jgi:hypothetical protein
LIEIELGQFSAARRDLYRAKVACELDRRDNALCATVLHNLATLHLHLQEYAKARALACQALDIQSVLR